MSATGLSVQRQQGAVLFVTLILLLVVTTLAISGVRESTLETRIVANTLESQQLFNAAEAGLREAERHIAQTTLPLAPCGKTPCLQGMATSYAIDFTAATRYGGAEGATSMGATVRWYIRGINPGYSGDQAFNAQYGNDAKGLGTYFYEVNSQAYSAELSAHQTNSRCSNGIVCLRSVVMRTFIE